MVWQIQKSMNMQEILDRVAEQWKFDEKNYPDMKGCSPEERKVMAIRHIFLHILNIEPLRKFIEVWKHGYYRESPSSYGYQLPTDLLKMARKQVLNYLRLLELIGESGENLQWTLTHNE